MAGRPATQWTPEQIEQIEQMAEAQCRNRTIAKALGIPESTFAENFRTLCSQKRAEGKALILRKQLDAVKDGVPAMLIWAGKQHLEQKDRQDVTSGDAPLSLHDVFAGVKRGSDDDE